MMQKQQKKCLKQRSKMEYKPFMASRQILLLKRKKGEGDI